MVRRLLSMKMSRKLGILFLLPLVLFLALALSARHFEKSAAERVDSLELSAGESPSLLAGEVKGEWERFRNISLAALLLYVAGALPFLIVVNRSFSRSIGEITDLMKKAEKGDLSACFVNRDLLKCWEELDCGREDCPAHSAASLRCWQVSGTHCQGEIQGDMALKLGSCEKCRVYQTAAADEVSAVGEAFNNMMAGIVSMFNQFKEAADAMFHASDRLASLSKSIKEGSEEQSNTLVEASSAVTEMSANIGQVTKTVEHLSLSSEEISSSIIEMSSSISQVASNSDSLSSMMEKNSSDIDSLFASVRETGEHASRLSSDVAGVSSSMTQMNTSVRESEEHAVRARDLSEDLSRNILQKSQTAAEEAVEGMERIRALVFDSVTAVQDLSSQSDSIGQILKVINEVSEQTNLLALNASIIAAQAGEHGRGFAVVADEIRELAERTASSTKEIEGVVNTIQGGLARAVTSMEAGSSSVRKGTELVGSIRKSLSEASEASTRSSEASGVIVRAAAEQGEGIKQATSASRNIAAMSENLATLTEEQSRTCDKLHEAVVSSRGMAGQVKAATVEQARSAQLVGESSRQSAEIAESLKRATREESQGITQIVEAVEMTLGMATANLMAVEKLDEMVAHLEEKARPLREATERFTLSTGDSGERS